HGDQIKQAQAQLEQQLDAIPDKNTADMAKRVLAPMFQAVSDCTAVLVSVDLRPEGVLLHTEVEVAADSKTNGLLKEWKSLPVAGPRRQLTAASVPAGGLVAAKYDDPAKAVAAQLKLYKELKEGSTLGAVLKADPVVKEKAEKHGGFEFNSISLKWDLEKTM